MKREWRIRRYRNGKVMAQTKKIRGEERKILRRVYREMKKELSPLLDDIRFKEITLKWWSKPIKKTRRLGFTAGKCWYTIKTIWLWYEYYVSNGIEQTIENFKHEVIHLIEPTHNARFKSLVLRVGGTRHASQIKNRSN